MHAPQDTLARMRCARVHDHHSQSKIGVLVCLLAVLESRSAANSGKKEMRGKAATAAAKNKPKPKLTNCEFIFEFHAQTR